MMFDISVIVDILSTLISAVLAILTYRMAKSTKKSVEEMRLSRKEANSAEVVVYFKARGMDLYLIIENIGKTVAKDIKISSIPKLENSRNCSFDKLKEISFLPPNYQIDSFFDTSKLYREKFNKLPNFTFLISYRNIYGDSIEREYVVNLNYLDNSYYLLSEADTVEMSLYKIGKNLDKLVDNLKK